MRRVLVVGALMSMAGCGLFSPSTKPLELAGGEYILTTIPWACGGGQNWPSVGAFVTLSHEGPDWVARSRSAADGSVEFRFHEVANSLVAGAAASGTLAGSGNEGRALLTTAMSVSFARSTAGGSATVAAQSTPGVGNSIAGSVTGQVVFADGAGAVLACPRAEIGLRLPAPCELDAAAPC
jgi:hypothetical protein